MKRTTVLNFRTCLEKTSQINGIGFYVNTKIRRFRVRLVTTTSIPVQILLLKCKKHTQNIYSRSCNFALKRYNSISNKKGFVKQKTRAAKRPARVKATNYLLRVPQKRTTL